MRPFVSRACGLVAAVLVLGFVAEAHAAVPRGILPQRRGNNRFTVPAKPAIIDSSPTIDDLNKALRALGSTDLDYDGHRLKAVEHVATAIHHLETATGKGKSNAAIEKAARGTAPVATKTATTPQAASDASLHKAKDVLFSVHHQLKDHTATRGHIRADADVRTAITEIVEALKPSTAAGAKAAAPAASTTTTTTAKAAR